MMWDTSGPQSKEKVGIALTVHSPRATYVQCPIRGLSGESVRRNPGVKMLTDPFPPALISPMARIQSFPIHQPATVSKHTTKSGAPQAAPTPPCSTRHKPPDRPRPSAHRAPHTPPRRAFLLAPPLLWAPVQRKGGNCPDRAFPTGYICSMPLSGLAGRECESESKHEDGHGSISSNPGLVHGQNSIRPNPQPATVSKHTTKSGAPQAAPPPP